MTRVAPFVLTAVLASASACQVECFSDNECALHCGCCGDKCGCGDAVSKDKEKERRERCMVSKQDCRDEQERTCDDGVQSYRAVCKSMKCTSELAP